MGTKINLGLFFGGRSPEHEISILSAKNIYEALDKKEYSIFLFGIDLSGRLFLLQDNFFDSSHLPKTLSPEDFVGDELQIFLGRTEKQFCDKNGNHISLDVAFPIVHGPNGEDGSLQGLFQLTRIPHVGSKILGSALAMDKDICKQILRRNGIRVASSVSLKLEQNPPDYSKISETLGPVLFVKSASQGSSMGVSKVSNKVEYSTALKEAFKWGDKVLIEKAIYGRELECAVIGNRNPKASVVGEVIIQNDFYSYEAKYNNENQTTIKVPAKLDEAIQKKIQKRSLRIFKILECSGLARCDFFLDQTNKLYVNEVNTLPGFTKISQYPQLWEASGISNTKLLDELIQLAIKNESKN